MRKSVLAALALLLAAPAVRAGDPPERNLTLPAEAGAHWLWVGDVLLERAALFDGDTGRFLGQLPAGKGIVAPHRSRDGREIYQAETYYARGTRGARTDLVSVTDARTLAPLAEIEIPAQALRAHVVGRRLRALGRRPLPRRLQPEPGDVAQRSSTSTKRRFAGEIQIPGCGLVYAGGARRFFTLCGDGTARVITLDAEGGDPARREHGALLRRADRSADREGRAARRRVALRVVRGACCTRSTSRASAALRRDAGRSLDDAELARRLADRRAAAPRAPRAERPALRARAPGRRRTRTRSRARRSGSTTSRSARACSSIGLREPDRQLRARAGRRRRRAARVDWLLQRLLPNDGVERIVVTQDDGAAALRRDAASRRPSRSTTRRPARTCATSRGRHRDLADPAPLGGRDGPGPRARAARRPRAPPRERRGRTSCATSRASAPRSRATRSCRSARSAPPRAGFALAEARARAGAPRARAARRARARARRGRAALRGLRRARSRSTSRAAARAIDCGCGGAAARVPLSGWLRRAQRAALRGGARLRRRRRARARSAGSMRSRSRAASRRSRCSGRRRTGSSRMRPPRCRDASAGGRMSDALSISNVVLWIVVLVLAAVVAALVRQIGVLHERVRPAGALALRKRARGRRGGAASSRPTDLAGARASPSAAPDPDGRDTLLFFVSPTCPVCKTLLPVVALARARARRLRVRARERRRRATSTRPSSARERIALPVRALGAELGLAYQVGKLPYAVLIDADGVLRAQGLVNTREHLESLFEAQARGVASMQEYLARERDAGRRREWTRRRSGSTGWLEATRAAARAPHLAPRLPRAARRRARRARPRCRCCRSRAPRAQAPARRSRRPSPAIPTQCDYWRHCAIDGFLCAAAAARTPRARPAPRCRRHLDRHLPESGRRQGLHHLVQRLLRERALRALLLQPQRGRPARLPGRASRTTSTGAWGRRPTAYSSTVARRPRRRRTKS